MNPDQLFKLVRDEIHKEHLYIGTRLSWYVVSQSFLMAAFAVSADKENWLPQWFFPSLGILITLPTILSLLIAFKAIHHFQEIESGLEKPFRDLPELYRGIGKAAPATLPFILLAAWIFALFLQR